MLGHIGRFPNLSQTQGWQFFPKHFFPPGFFWFLQKQNRKKTLHKLKTTIENPESYKIIYLNFLYLNVTRIVALIHLIHIYTFIIFYIIFFML